MEVDLVAALSTIVVDVNAPPVKTYVVAPLAGCGDDVHLLSFTLYVSTACSDR